MEKNKKYIKSNFILILLFLIALVLNCMSSYVADDFSYMLSFKDGSRIEHIWQVFPSIVAHYMTINGRTMPHFLVMLFLIPGKWLFNICNALVYVAIIGFATNHYAQELKLREKALLQIMFAVLLWQFTPSYGQIYFWLDGSINYSWSYLWAMLYTGVYMDLYMSKEPLKKTWQKVVFVIFALLFGAYSETVTFVTAFVCFIIWLLKLKQNKTNRPYYFFLAPIVASALGYLTILASPGGKENHVALASVGTIVKNMIKLFSDFYTSQKALILIFAVVMTYAIGKKVAKHVLVLAWGYFAMTVISIAMLSVGSYLEERVYAAPVFFLVAASMTLLCELMKTTGTNLPVKILCVYMIVGQLLNIYNGMYDIMDTGRRVQARDAYIEEMKAEGQTDITIPEIEAATIYCNKYGLVDLMAEDEDWSWPNGAMAKYYGVNHIFREK